MLWFHSNWTPRGYPARLFIGARGKPSPGAVQPVQRSFGVSQLWQWVMMIELKLCHFPPNYSNAQEELTLERVRFEVQGPAKEWFSGCENFSGKARQKWRATARTKFSQPGIRFFLPGPLHMSVELISRPVPSEGQFHY